MPEIERLQCEQVFSSLFVLKLLRGSALQAPGRPGQKFLTKVFSSLTLFRATFPDGVCAVPGKEWREVGTSWPEDQGTLLG